MSHEAPPQSGATVENAAGLARVLAEQTMARPMLSRNPMPPKHPTVFGVRGRLLHERVPRVLLADDDDDFRAALASTLAEDGCSVVEARDGCELLELLAPYATSPPVAPYDAIVTDIVMPGFSGIDVLTALRRHLGSTKVVVVTGFGDARTYRVARALGSVAVMKKPLDFDDLRTTLANVLGAA